MKKKSLFWLISCFLTIGVPVWFNPNTVSVDTASQKLPKPRYSSIGDYPAALNGDQFKRTPLHIHVQDDQTIDLQMKLKLSKALLERFKQTAHPPTFSFAANVNQDVLSPYVKRKQPAHVTVDFTSISNRTIVIKQRLSLKSALTPYQKKQFLDAENYQFLFLNEHDAAAGIVFDLDLSTWDSR